MKLIMLFQKTINKLTQLPIKNTNTSFWVNPKNYYYIKNKDDLRKRYVFQESDYLVGSFQEIQREKMLTFQN